MRESSRGERPQGSRALARTLLQTVSILSISAGCVALIESQHAISALSTFIIALLTWPLAQLLRTWGLWDLTPFRTDVPAVRVADGQPIEIAGVLIRKSLWWLLPLAWTVAVPQLSIARLTTLPLARTWVPHAIATALLIAYLALFIADAREKKVSVGRFVSAAARSFLGAGLPEELLIAGFIGGSLFRLLSNYATPWVAALITAVSLDVAFSLSHIPTVLRNRRFYAENMTGTSRVGLLRTVGQMVVFGMIGWAFYFATGSVWYPIIFHTLSDLAAILSARHK